MSWFGLFGYKGSINDDGLILSDIFGKKYIPWIEIISVSSGFHNDSDWSYMVVTNTDYYLVYPQDKDFEKLLVEKSSLKQCAESSDLNFKRKRWSKVGHIYKHANMFDKFNDINFHSVD